MFSVDSDTIPLGCNLIVNKVKWGTNDEGKKCIKYSVLRRAGVIDRVGSWLSQHATGDYPQLNEGGLLALCNFLGNDYIRRVKGNGPTACAKLTIEWLLASPDGRDALLARMDYGKEWGGGGGGTALCP